MSELKGQDSELSMTIQIKRAATGEVEEHILTATVTPDQLEALKADYPNLKAKE
jgi:hypothetical protein